MVQAAALSGLDFKEADFRSRFWNLKAAWILRRIEDMHLEKMLQMQHAQHLSVLSYETEQNIFDAHWKTANQLIQQIHNINFPWIRGKTKAQSERQAALAAWRKQFGDMSDPKVKAHFKQVADAIRRKGDEAAKIEPEFMKAKRALQDIVRKRRSSNVKGK